jgi:hypothetical protein
MSMQSVQNHLSNTLQGLNRSIFFTDQQTLPFKFEKTKKKEETHGQVALIDRHTTPRKRVCTYDSTRRLDGRDERDGWKEPGGFPQGDQGETSFGQAQLWGGLPRCVASRRVSCVSIDFERMNE